MSHASDRRSMLVNADDSSKKSVRFQFYDPQEGRDDVEKSALVPAALSNTNNSSKNVNTSNGTTETHTDGSSSTSKLEAPLTLLIEIAGITLPLDKTAQTTWMMDLQNPSALNPRGMHCTASWIEKIQKTKGEDCRETVLHRTKTMRVEGKKMDAEVTVSASESSDGSVGGVEAEERNAQHILTVDDSSLFLFKTTMKELLAAQDVASLENKHMEDVKSSKQNADQASRDMPETSPNQARSRVKNNGGIRFDIFEKPIDALSSIYRTVLAESTKEKEDHATEAEAFSFNSKKVNLSSYNASYRLVGSVFLTPEEILRNCDAEQFECDLFNGLRREQRNCNQKTLQRKPSTLNSGNGGKLALRIRKASDFDVAFIRTLQYCDVNNVPITVEMLNNVVRQNDPSRKRLKPVTITTEVDEKEVAAKSSLKAIENFSPQAIESVRYLFFSDDTERRVMVKPYPDPKRVEQTQWFTEEELNRECWKDSTNWIKAGSGSLGKVYVEVLSCRDLPNVDTGPGNKTDAFVSIVYGDVMVQTDVIDDSLAPMWMPWTKRAYVFSMDHPSTVMYVGVVDYDVGPLEHECIGRVAVQINKFSPGMLYTLSYKLYESSNLTDRGEGTGIITLRLRVEYDEVKFLQEGWKTPSPRHVNSQQWKSHRVAKYCCDGPHDEEVFEMIKFRSHINEILTAKRTLMYVISDALNSIIFWRGQVKVGQAWLPVHSAVVFYFSVCLVESPQLLPSYAFFAMGWIMMANMFQREHNPNPWRRGHSFGYYWNILIQGKSLYEPRIIEPLEGHKEAVKYEKLWQDRLDEDDARWEKQYELDAKVKEISDESVIRTKAKANAPLADPISSLAGARLLPYQQRLGRYCKKIRYTRNVLNWSESVIAFWWTLALFGCGAVSLFVPWAFILQWTSRIVVWTFLGPWMKAADIYFHGLTLEEELKRAKAKSADELHSAFKLQYQAAKVLRENTLKLKAFRVRLFGQFITRLPEFELARHEDIPLPESSAEPYDGESHAIDAKLFIPGQNLRGVMIPSTGEYNVKSESVTSERDALVDQFNNLLTRQGQEEADDDIAHENFELVSNDDQILCIRSSDSVENNSEERMLERLSSSTCLVSSSSAEENSEARANSRLSSSLIQTALNNLDIPEVEEVKPRQKSKWVFSASIQLALTKEPISEEGNPRVPLLEDDKFGQKMIEDEAASEIEEEGVEVVEYLCDDSESNRDDALVSSDDHAETEHVSVLYLKPNDSSTHDNDPVKPKPECKSEHHERKKPESKPDPENCVHYLKPGDNPIQDID